MAGEEGGASLASVAKGGGASPHDSCGGVARPGKEVGPRDTVGEGWGLTSQCAQHSMMRWRKGVGPCHPAQHRMAGEGGRALLLPCGAGGAAPHRWGTDVLGGLRPQAPHT